VTAACSAVTERCHVHRFKEETNRVAREPADFALTKM
jgi:hypothetical protein